MMLGNDAIYGIFQHIGITMLRVAFVVCLQWLCAAAYTPSIVAPMHGGNQLHIETPYRVVGNITFDKIAGCKLWDNSLPHALHSFGPYAVRDATLDADLQFIPLAFCQYFFLDPLSRVEFSAQCGIDGHPGVGFVCTSMATRVYNYCPTWTDVANVTTVLLDDHSSFLDECRVCESTAPPTVSSWIVPNANLTRGVDTIAYNDRKTYEITLGAPLAAGIERHLFVTVTFQAEYRFVHEMHVVSLYGINATSGDWVLCEPMEFVRYGNKRAISHNFTITPTFDITIMRFAATGFYGTDQFKVAITPTECPLSALPLFVLQVNPCFTCADVPILPAPQTFDTRYPQHQIAVVGMHAGMVGLNVVFHDKLYGSVIYTNNMPTTIDKHSFSIIFNNTDTVDAMLAFNAMHIVFTSYSVLPAVSVAVVDIYCALFQPQYVVDSTLNNTYAIDVPLSTPVSSGNQNTLWQNMYVFLSNPTLGAWELFTHTYVLPSVDNNLLFFPAEYDLIRDSFTDQNSEFIYMVNSNSINISLAEFTCVDVLPRLFTNNNTIITRVRIQTQTSCTLPTSITFTCQKPTRVAAADDFPSPESAWTSQYGVDTMTEDAMFTFTVRDSVYLYIVLIDPTFVTCDDAKNVKAVLEIWKSDDNGDTFSNIEGDETVYFTGLRCNTDSDVKQDGYSLVFIHTTNMVANTTLLQLRIIGPQTVQDASWIGTYQMIVYAFDCERYLEHENVILHGQVSPYLLYDGKLTTDTRVYLPKAGTFSGRAIASTAWFNTEYDLTSSFSLDGQKYMVRTYTIDLSTIIDIKTEPRLLLIYNIHVFHINEDYSIVETTVAHVDAHASGIPNVYGQYWNVDQNLVMSSDETITVFKFSDTMPLDRRLGFVFFDTRNDTQTISFQVTYPSGLTFENALCGTTCIGTPIPQLHFYYTTRINSCFGRDETPVNVLC